MFEPSYQHDEIDLQTYFKLAQYGAYLRSPEGSHGIMSNNTLETPPASEHSSSKLHQDTQFDSDCKGTVDSSKDCYHQLDPKWHQMVGDYEIISRLGKGCYGEVVEAVHRGSGKKVAIKLLQNCFSDPYEAKKTIREIEILRNFSMMPNGHMFVTKLWDVILPEKPQSEMYIFLVLDIMQTDFNKVLRNKDVHVSD